MRQLHNWLVVDLPLWKMMEFVSWDDDIPNIWKNKKCSKPPTKQSSYKNHDFKNKDLIHVGLRTGYPIPATG